MFLHLGSDEQVLVNEIMAILNIEYLFLTDKFNNVGKKDDTKEK